MKYLLAILILLELLSCKNSKPAAIEEMQNQPVVKDNSVEKELGNLQQVQTTFPAWLETIKRTKNKEMSRYGIDHKIDSFMELNDSLSYAIFSITDGVCLKQELETYWNKNFIDHLGIGESCDHDLSIPKHSWQEYELKTPTKIHITTFTESVPDSLIDKEGYLKEGYDLETQTKIDTTVKTYLINKDGKIVPHKK